MKALVICGGEETSTEKIPVAAVSYLLRVIKPTHPTLSIINSCEAMTLATVLDKLALGQTAAAADVVANRMKAIEKSLADGGGELGESSACGINPDGARDVNGRMGRSYGGEGNGVSGKLGLGGGDYQSKGGKKGGKGKTNPYYDGKGNGKGKGKGKYMNSQSDGVAAEALRKPDAGGSGCQSDLWSSIGLPNDV